MTTEKILSLQGLIVSGKPTVAGLMLLGEYPQAFFSQMSIPAMVVAGTSIGCGWVRKISMLI